QLRSVLEELSAHEQVGGLRVRRKGGNALLVLLSAGVKGALSIELRLQAFGVFGFLRLFGFARLALFFSRRALRQLFIQFSLEAVLVFIPGFEFLLPDNNSGHDDDREKRRACYAGPDE